MPYPPPPYGPPGAPQQPPMYNYDLNQPPNRHPIYQQQNPNMMYQHHPPMQGHWQAPQYASSQPPINNVYNIYIGGALQYSSSLQPNITYHFGNVAPPQYAAPPNPVYGPQQQQPAAPPYPQQTYPHMPNQAAPPNYAPIYPTQPMPQQPGYAEYVRSPAYAARPGGAALPDDGRAFARRRRNSSRPGVDQLADAVGRKVFIETPTPSPDSTKATGGVPTDVPGRPEIRGRRSVSRSPCGSESDRRVRPGEQDELRKDYRKLLKTADEFRARFPGRTYIAPESWQLHKFTLRQHRKRLVGIDQLGRRYLNATDWGTFPENGRKDQQREWMERHGFYVCCVECKALRRDCSHTYPCSECRSNGRQCRLVHPGHDHEICRFDMTCEEPHDEYFAFLDFCLGIPKNTIKFWKFPSKLFRQTEHGCQDRNGAPCNARQMPMRGIALPYDADNPYGYVTRRPPRWICEQFKPQAD
ncbi:hypothetical protein KC315_g3264 [Hortaea werneckii]|uniref:Zn(2)-C6 fungal-type domain-containing protein n=1 Tax=Hortaea werneckii TaxID=91943 RepID=A0A3M7CTK0_HORWE|nr:hypothetical protein KC315_g3264 [Hortaea werneckii]KAI7367107.1 hypothetical protein KC354_g3698 [Hortaea werneckii]RMY54997.1 hypothetical protein D0863_13450 [Hortaea werneckii]